MLYKNAVVASEHRAKSDCLVQAFGKKTSAGHCEAGQACLF